MGYSSHAAPRQARNTVDGLLSRVLALPCAPLYQFLEGLMGRVLGWRIAEKRLAPRPCEQRDAQWVCLNDGGLSYGDIARAEHVSPRTVARACQRFRRRDSESLSPPFTPYAS